jgi:hypothetical protein
MGARAFASGKKILPLHEPRHDGSGAHLKNGPEGPLN